MEKDNYGLNDTSILFGEKPISTSSKDNWQEIIDISCQILRNYFFILLEEACVAVEGLYGAVEFWSCGVLGGSCGALEESCGAVKGSLGALYLSFDILDKSCSALYESCELETSDFTSCRQCFLLNRKIDENVSKLSIIGYWLSSLCTVTIHPLHRKWFYVWS